MRILQLSGVLVAITAVAICQIVVGKTLSARPPSAPAEAEVVAVQPATLVLSASVDASTEAQSLLSRDGSAATDSRQKIQDRLEQQEQDKPEQQEQGKLEQQEQDKPEQQEQGKLEQQEQGKLEQQESAPVRDYSADPTPKQGQSYLAYYAYAELPPDKKPAEIVLESLKDTPIGTPVDEIKHAADAFGLDFNFMKTVAKIESDFDPKQRTGSYIGLFQLNNYEFNKYGTGEITNPRDNAIAAAYKFVNEGTLFELDTHKKPTFSDLYLIHQQGWQGAAEHVAHPDRTAWKSMCATDEGREKGEKWCKRAIWQNTLPAIKHIWKSVDNLTSGEFVHMWRERVDHLYSRYSEAVAGDTKN
jgi:Transglycosylase SLT domain